MYYIMKQHTRRLTHRTNNKTKGSYTKRRGAGLLSFLGFGKQLNAKDRAWKKHTETRVTFLRNLKIYIDNRQNTCANKDMYKKCIKLYKYLNKIHKNNDVSKFVKTLQNLKDIVKEWDYLVTEKVAHIGKVCGILC